MFHKYMYNIFIAIIVYHISSKMVFEENQNKYDIVVVVLILLAKFIYRFFMEIMTENLCGGAMNMKERIIMNEINKQKQFIEANYYILIHNGNFVYFNQLLWYINSNLVRDLFVDKKSIFY